MSAPAGETASARATRLMAEVGAEKKTNYTKGEVKLILNQFTGFGEAGPQLAGDEGCRAPATVSAVQRGDVFIAKVVGGKVRPWIVLAVADGVVRAVAMTSGDSVPRAVQAKCRLWPGSWIGTTLTLFTLDQACAEVTRPYTNLRHLAEVEAEIRDIYADPGPARVTSIAEIRARLCGDADQHNGPRGHRERAGT